MQKTKFRKRKHRNCAHRTDLPLLRLAFNENDIPTTRTYNSYFIVNLVVSPKKLDIATLSHANQCIFDIDVAVCTMPKCLQFMS